uniref:Uncharacterized protein n=1 Tax=Candidatus Methanophagaceae archaeon ANME-1 ERB6 TaxID=2759912 RepID=A0A7G9YV33_9EURY|nr:hypothetical protein DNKLAFBN_00007 [Methanosarcinales archaeon ANME-1 ERB6]
MGVEEYKISDEGLTIPLNVLKKIGLERDAYILISGHTIIIKPKSLTEKVKGIIKGTPLSEKDLEELYHEYKGE